MDGGSAQAAGFFQCLGQQFEVDRQYEKARSLLVPTRYLFWVVDVHADRRADTLAGLEDTIDRVFHRGMAQLAGDAVCGGKIARPGHDPVHLSFFHDIVEVFDAFAVFHQADGERFGIRPPDVRGEVGNAEAGGADARACRPRAFRPVANGSDRLARRFVTQAEMRNHDAWAAGVEQARQVRQVGGARTNKRVYAGAAGGAQVRHGAGNVIEPVLHVDDHEVESRTRVEFGDARVRRKDE